MGKKGASENVQVAVRCRPYLSIDGPRETFKCGVEMEGPSTRIFSLDTNESRKFTFDYSFWSHNPDDSHFVDNSKVYLEMGTRVLDTAWEGYNVSLFAYGQTGSGKSYSMIGIPSDPGIVPRASEEIFKRIQKITEDQEQKDLPENERIFFDVKASMLEIYNEQVRDLLNPKGNPPGGLKIRESKQTGPFVDGLTYEKVNSYEEIQKTMEEGTKMRTVRSTVMNSDSSRAHTMVQIVLSQKKINQKSKGPKDKFRIFKESKINLVDLAGAEKQKHTGTSGAGLAEGIAINTSLSYLGKCITALADRSSGKKNVIVPYRESKLTFIMKESLGGNSKTIMICAVRPGHEYFQESLSTLRYADQAKKIKNKAVVNEDPRDAAIKKLKEEVELLKKQLSKGGGGALGGDDDDDDDEGGGSDLIAELQRQLAESQSVISHLQNETQDVEEKTMEMQKARAAALVDSGIGADFDRSSVPHILNLQEDPAQNGILAYQLNKEGDMTLGRMAPGEAKPDIVLSGLGIKKHHATFFIDGAQIYITPVDGAPVHHNGQTISDKTELKHNDRVIIGNNHVFKVVNPKAPEHEENDEISWEYAQKEYAKAQGHLKEDISAEKEKEMQLKMQQMEEEFKRKQQETEAELERKRKEMEEEMKKKQDALDSAAAKALEEKLKQQQEELLAKQAELENIRRQHEEDEQRLKEEKQKQDLKNWLEQQILELIPLVKDANEIANELGKKYQYELKVLQTFEDGSSEPVSKLAIVNKQLDTGLTSIWNEDNFKERVYKMKDIYTNYVDSTQSGVEFAGIDANEDPFEDEALDEAQTVGHASVLMKSLAYLLDNEVFTEIFDMSGNRSGELKVDIIPCDEKGDMLEDVDVTSGEELIGKKMCFKIKIPFARGLNKNRCEDSYCRYRLPIDTEWQETRICPERTINPEWNYERIVRVDPVTPAFVDWIENQMLNIEVLAKQSTAETEGKKKKRKGIKEFQKELEEMKASRDEAKMNLRYIIEEKDEVVSHNRILQNELDEVLLELEELQTGFFGQEEELMQKPKLSRQSTQALLREDLEKLKGRIVDLENQKLKLERDLAQAKSNGGSAQGGASGNVSSDDVGKLKARISELEKQLTEKPGSKQSATKQSGDSSLLERIKQLESQVRTKDETIDELSKQVSKEPIMDSKPVVTPKSEDVVTKPTSEMSPEELEKLRQANEQMLKRLNDLENQQNQQTEQKPASKSCSVM